jgi:O-antigen/teichoic acid export membrane protein
MATEMRVEPGSAERRDLRRIIVRNTLAVTAGSWLAKAVNFSFNVFTVRLLGEAGLGHYATVVAFVGLFGVFFELGMSQYVERTIAQDRTRTLVLFWNLVLLRLILAVLGVAVTTSIAFFMGYQGMLVLGVALYSATFLLAAFLTPLTVLLTANERFDLSTMIQFVGQFLTAVLGLVLLRLGAGFIGLICSGLVVMPIQIALCSGLIRRYQLGNVPFQISLASWPAFIRASLPFGLTSLALTFNFSVDTIILSLFYAASVVGWYNAAYRLVFNLVSLASGFYRAITPSLAREHVHNPTKAQAWARVSLQGLLLFALPIAVGTSLLAPRLVTLLYGASYAPTGKALMVIAWDVPLLMLTALLGNVTTAMGLERAATRIYLCTAGLNVVLNLLCIPRFGLLAAATVTVFTDSIAAIWFCRLLAAPLELRQIRSSVLRAGYAVTLMGVLVWLMQPFALPLVIVAGALSYAAFILWFRALEIAPLYAVVRGLFQRTREVQDVTL